MDWLCLGLVQDTLQDYREMGDNETEIVEQAFGPSFGDSRSRNMNRTHSSSCIPLIQWIIGI
jgi:hypothetical protein